MGWPAPIAALLYVLFVKRCILDGWPGWYYALQRLFAETLLALEILDRRIAAMPIRPRRSRAAPARETVDNGPATRTAARTAASAGRR